MNKKSNRWHMEVVKKKKKKQKLNEDGEEIVGGTASSFQDNDSRVIM